MTAMEIFAYGMAAAFVIFWVVLVYKLIGIVSAKKESDKDE